MTADEELLRWLIIAIIALFLFGIAFAATATTLHLIRKRRQERESALEARWTAALHDVLAGDRAPEVLWSLVDANERRHFVAHLVEYAARLRGEELDLLRALATPMLADIAADLPASNAGRRAFDIRALATLGMPQYAPQVLGALKDRSQLVAATAVQALCQQEYAEHAPTVIASMPRFASWSSRFLGLLLARFGAEAADSLRRLLADYAAAPALRVAAAHALWRMGDVAAVEPASGILERVDDEGLIVACLRILERVGDERHAEVVRRQLHNASGNVRSSAVSALTAIGAPSDDQSLREALADPSPWVALRAASGLARTNRSSLQMAAVEDDDQARSVAREALSDP
jgi:HEAT repeat protein